MTELPVLGDHLTVAAVALTAVGAIAVYTAALPFTWVTVTLIHIYKKREKVMVEHRTTGKEIKSSSALQHYFTSIFQVLHVLHVSAWVLYGYSTFLSQSKTCKLGVRFIGQSKLLV